MAVSLSVGQKRVGPILGGHPWVFSGAIRSIPEGLTSGEVIDLRDDDGIFLARGYFNSYSQIAVRILTYHEEEQINEAFFTKKIARALKMRSEYVLSDKTDACRVIHSENDGIPGLVVDKYGDYLSLQFHTPGLEVFKEMIISALVAVVKPLGIYERSDVAVRQARDEGGERLTLYGEVPDRVEIKENGLRFIVDIKEGQKTGFFLDQREKRKALQGFAKGKDVVNCFSYSGGFSVYAAAAGAKSVKSIDVSASAIELAKENMELNGFVGDQYTYEVEDVKKYLKEAEDACVDILILDPPAFIKSRHKIRQGVRGYRNINEEGLRLVREDGILVSCSCSSHLSYQDFRHLLSEAGARSGKQLQILETFFHGMDHPELVPYTESTYLKTLFMRVWNR